MAIQVATAAINVPRDSHYVLNAGSGLYERSLLLEAARTNSCLWSRDLTNAAWSSTGTGTVTQTATGLDGTPNTATRLTDSDAAAHYTRFQSVTIPNDSAIHVCRFWVAKDTNVARFVGLEFAVTGGATPKTQRNHLNTATGATLSVASLGGGGSVRVLDAGNWWLLEITVQNNSTGNTTARPVVYPAIASVIGTEAVATTGACSVGNVNLELSVGSTVGSSAIFTTTVAVTRSADSCSVPFPFAPMAMTLYARFFEMGTILLTNARYLELSSSADVDPRLIVYMGSPYISVYHGNGTSSVSASQAVAPAVGDLVEIRAVLNADGSVFLGQSINGAAETVSGTSAALALASAWAANTLWVNSIGASLIGFAAFTQVKVQRGVQTLATMRAA